MAESSSNSPDDSSQPISRLTLTGSGCIRFVSAVFALGAAFHAFDTFLQLRKLALAREFHPLLFSRALLYGFTLILMTFLLWSYAGAIRDYPGSSEARRLERAHIDVWRWAAILLVAHLVFTGLVIAVWMPF